MSSYIKKVKHPKTGKMVKALFLDNYFGGCEYGVGFRKDGEDADIGEIMPDLDFYKLEDLEI